MPDQPLVSVIVPIYGVEAYLDRCVTSLVTQQYKCLQIVLIDDGSPDRCPAMCDAWVERDSRVIVVHKENGGLASARNAGLDMIQGDLVTFVDSDDWVEPDYVSSLVAWKQQYNADVTMCACVHNTEDGRQLADPACATTPEGKFSQAHALEDFFYHRSLAGPVWGKLFDVRFFQDPLNIRFYDGLNSEDYYLLTQVFMAMNSIYVNMTPLYHYLIRRGSIARSQSVNTHTCDELAIADMCCDYAVQHGYADAMALAYFRSHGRSDVLFNLFQSNAKASQCRSVARELRGLLPKVLHNPKVPSSEKAKLFILSYIPMLYHGLQRVLEKNQKS